MACSKRNGSCTGASHLGRMLRVRSCGVNAGFRLDRRHAAEVLVTPVWGTNMTTTRESFVQGRVRQLLPWGWPCFKKEHFGLPFAPYRAQSPLRTHTLAQNARGCHQRQCSYSTHVFRHL